MGARSPPPHCSHTVQAAPQHEYLLSGHMHQCCDKDTRLSVILHAAGCLKHQMNFSHSAATPPVQSLHIVSCPLSCIQQQN